MSGFARKTTVSIWALPYDIIPIIVSVVRQINTCFKMSDNNSGKNDLKRKRIGKNGPYEKSVKSLFQF